MPGKGLDVFLPVVMFIGAAIAMTLISYLAAYLISSKDPHELKEMPYECGEIPEGSAWSAFHVRFYVVGLIFIIFDVESVVMFPAALVYKKFLNIGEGSAVLIIFLLFISVLVEGIVYCWKKGDLDWVRTYQKVKRD